MPLLYMIDGSPPCRAVQLLAQELSIPLTLKNVNIPAKEQFAPEFLKINPQHTVPVLDDNGFILIDSHSIMTYFVSKYGKNDSLYPKDLQKRAIVDQRLHFDSNILFARGARIVKRVFYEQKRDVVPEDLAALVEAYEIVEKFLDSNQYVAGDKLTVADFSFWTSLTTWNGIGVYTEDKYPRIAAWLNRMSELPYSKINKEAVDSFKGYFLQLTGQAQ
ncbi:glutathione S-transferase 1-like [Diabrotica virgifera virgifera]|uniref:Glutathione S-transferase 1-like n=1 Tax=Diabrotica virgifera virgifera TaxID=50390 RepID=A0ABM5KYA5_DIAVI|nr:glutathione S-transferase 1-like [Diabrotica virgifera virgifera]